MAAASLLVVWCQAAAMQQEASLPPEVPRLAALVPLVASYPREVSLAPAAAPCRGVQVERLVVKALVAMPR